MRFFLLLFLLPVFQLSGQKPAVLETFSQLEKRIKSGGDTLFVINFWATWCKPCVEELPFFEELHQKSAGKKIKVLLVSIDFKSQMVKRLVPFLREQKLKSEVLLLADQNVDSWIPKIDEKWDGAIPVTWFVRGAKHNFKRDKFLNFNELDAFVQSF